MNQNIGEQINSVINNLAGKLGVAADKVYPLLVKQAYVDGFIAIAYILVGLSICFIAYKGFKIFPKIKLDEKCISSCWDTNDWAMFFVLIMVIMIIGCIFILGNINTAINAFGNPEWYAIQQVINQLKELK